uniref:NACHT, LRR and PYD domains-containing protein 3-like n=1 Tax=Phallusia mammillata TaxID=59560 RepID=A0A6F9DML0_9ASCI|nr:NACHT, LRR and PYD domains-containing protein 3-like [Phallusia mammillata]
MFFLSFDEFQKHVSQFTSSRWEVVSKFMFGLCNNQTKSQIQRLLPATVATSDLWSQKKQAIQEFADQLSISISTFDAPEQCPKLLQVSTWLNEANDSEMTNAIMHNLSANLHLSGTFFPTDATSIAFLLASGNKDWKVNINNIQFVADSCVILFQSIELNKCKTPMLYLGFNDMDVEMVALIAKCLRGTEKLWMVNCSLTGACIQALQLGIKQLKEQMEFLYLNNNPFGDSGATHLAGCLGHLKVLNLNNCSITSIGVESLAFALQRLGHKLHILNLRNNSICDAGVSALGTCIFNLDVLDINNCKISGTGAGELAGALTALTQPMELINIGNNAIGDQGAYAFSKCLEKVSELWMKDCGVTETGLKQMQKMHSQLLKNTRVYLGQIPGMGQTYIDLL